MSPADTRSTGYDVCTHATRGVYCGAGAVLEVAKETKKILLEFASRILDAYPHSLALKYDEKENQTVVYVVGNPEKNMTLAEVATEAMHKDWGTAIFYQEHPEKPPVRRRIPAILSRSRWIPGPDR